MGWLFYRKPEGPIRAHMDEKLTFTTERGTSRVLRSAVVKWRTYYAAVEEIVGETRRVYAVVCLLSFTRTEFGYKDMSEDMGPVESDCPKAILDLLTPTDSKYAQEWRERCRSRAERRATKTVKDGDVLQFEHVSWNIGGESFSRFRAIKDGRSFRFAPVGGIGSYKLRGWSSRNYEVIAHG